MPIAEMSAISRNVVKDWTEPDQRNRPNRHTAENDIDARVKNGSEFI